MRGTGRQGRGYVTCPTCGGGGQVSGNVSGQPSSSYDSSEQQRALEERRKKDQEGEKLRQQQFEKSKQDALKSLKRITDNELGLKGVGESNELGLKSLSGTSAGGIGLKAAPKASPTPAPIAYATPQIAAIYKSLDEIQVPPPLPQKESQITWGSTLEAVSLRGRSADTALKVADNLLLGLDLVVKASGRTVFMAKVILIAGKTFIAGEEGAYVHLVKREEVYEQALKYLKNSAKSGHFVQLVKAMKEGKPMPPATDANMLQAAKALLDPSLGSGSARIAWGSMISPEALAAMTRKACLEVSSEIAGSALEEVLPHLEGQQEAFDAIMRERGKARALLGSSTSALERQQLRAAMHKTNDLMKLTYRLETVESVARAKVGAALVEDMGGGLKAIYLNWQQQKAAQKKTVSIPPMQPVRPE